MTNKDKYIEFCKNKDNIPIFSQPWWLDVVSGEDEWNVSIVEKGGNIFATMPYYIEKKYGQIVIKNPKLTQTLGIYFNYPKNQKYYKKLSFEKEMIGKLIKQLPLFSKFSKSFHFNYQNILPFHWLGFESKINYTYTIENISIEELEKKFETDIRRRRRKALNLGIDVYESDDIETFYELNKKTFIRQGVSIPYCFEFVKRVYSIVSENSAGKILFAKYEDRVIAAIFLVYDNQSVYYIMGGIDPEKRDLGAMDLLQYESIRFALNSKRSYDFEGSMIESIEKYFRSFGSIQKAYFQVTKTQSKILKTLEFIKGLKN